MKTFCVNYKKYATKKISSVRKTKKCRLKPLSNSIICGKKINFYTK